MVVGCGVFQCAGGYRQDLSAQDAGDGATTSGIFRFPAAPALRR